MSSTLDKSRLTKTKNQLLRMKGRMGWERRWYQESERKSITNLERGGLDRVIRQGKEGLAERYKKV